MRRAILSGFLLLATLLVCELSLGAARLASGRVDYLLTEPSKRVSVPDPRLGRRLSPFAPGNDERGFRNGRGVARADILAVGDSYTYGWGAPAEESWPAQLASLSGRTAYNAGIVGYGFCEYEGVIDELIELHPQVVVLGVFVGNDLGDVYRAVYQEHRCADLQTSDPEVAARLATLDAQATIAERAVELGWDSIPVPPSDPAPLARGRRWLALHSSLYGLAREVRGRLSPRPVLDYEAASHLPGRLAWSGPEGTRTVFKSPDMFSLTVDLDDPRIREGLRMGEEVLHRERVRLAERGIRLVVVLIPDKISAYEPLMFESEEHIPEDFVRFEHLESRVRAELSGFLRDEGITIVDVTPAMRDGLRRGLAVYPESDDHHNSAQGYHLIAELVESSLEADRTAASDPAGPQRPRRRPQALARVRPAFRPSRRGSPSE